MSTNFLNIDPSHLYDPARQSPTLAQKQYYSDWSTANPQLGAQTVTDPIRKAAYDTWLKDPQQLDFEQWYSRQSGTPEQQATWNAADANWMSSPLMPQAPNPGVYTPPTNAMQSGAPPAPAPIPPSPWQTQPKPAGPISQQASYPTQTAGNWTSSLPGLPGDTATGGSVGPNGLWNEANVGTPRPLPVAPPWAPNPMTQPPAAPTPQGSPSTPAAGGFTEAPGVGPGVGGIPGSERYPFPNNFQYPKFSYNQVEDYKNNPAYQSQLKDSERALNRRLLATGRSDSTGGINAMATNQRKLGAEFEQKAYERAVSEDNIGYARAREQNMNEFDRATLTNKLMYDRDYQERVLSYEQKFRENERMYGRAKAEEQLAYDRQWDEYARDFAYFRFLIESGMRAAGTPAA